MAKRSAKSKGYRHQTAKKPYLSKKEIAILCLVVLAIGIGAFFLFRYDDGALKVQDGAVVTEGDNWLIVNGSNVRGRARYFKLGEIGEIEGASREKSASLTDANLPEYVFTLQDAAEGVDDIRVGCGHGSAVDMAKFTMNALTAMEGNTLSTLQTADIGGRTLQYYTIDSHSEAPEEATAEAEAAEAAEGEPAKAEEADATEAEVTETESVEAAKAEEADAGYTRTLTGYIDASHDSCIVLRAEGSADTANACPTDEALLNALTAVINAVTLED